MIVTIIIIVALLFVVAVAAGIRFVYLLTVPHTNIRLHMKSKILDLFLYLGVAISLIMSVSNLLQVVFAAINRKYPDLISSGYYVEAMGNDVRLAVASLVVMFPIYIGLSWYIARDIKKYLFKQDIVIRKTMIYATLFISVLALIGTLVSSIYTYLGGELSIRFALKAGAVLAVAFALFMYYLYTLRRDYAKQTLIPALCACLAIAVVVSSVMWSISVIGTPQEIRAKKIDNTRLSDISRIQQEILNRIQMTDKLPLTLRELDNAFQGYQVPVDPVSQEAYGYKILQQPTVKMNYATNKKELVTSAIFELCATFDTSRELDARGAPVYGKGGDMMVSESLYSASNYYYEGDQSPFWNHGVGETCFKRIITSDMYYGR